MIWMALCAWLLLAGCAPVQVQMVAPQMADAPRDWFSATELEAALLVADVAAEERTAALCSEDPEQPGRLWSCVQYDGRELLHYWWVATWDADGQRIKIRWQNQVEVQL